MAGGNAADPARSQLASTARDPPTRGVSTAPRVAAGGILARTAEEAGAGTARWVILKQLQRICLRFPSDRGRCRGEEEVLVNVRGEGVSFVRGDWRAFVGEEERMYAACFPAPRVERRRAQM